MAKPATPLALTVAGSDSSGGAGIQADLKTFAALDVFGTTAITAITAQNTVGVRAVHMVPPEIVRSQIDAVFDDMPVGVVKTGMLGTSEAVSVVCEALRRRPSLPPLVVDPVLIATSGDALGDAGVAVAIAELLIPLATILTPNLDEAAALLREPSAGSDDEAQYQARQFLKLGANAVLLKGGHGSGETATDWLASGDDVIPLTLPRLETRNTHGTGCTLAAAIAAHLARGDELLGAVEKAKQFVWDAIDAARHRQLGAGNGPLDHGFVRRNQYSKRS